METNTTLIIMSGISVEAEPAGMKRPTGSASPPSFVQHPLILDVACGLIQSRTNLLGLGHD